MADHAERTTVGIDPRQLLLKSNPGLYGVPNNDNNNNNSNPSRDLTNPRDMYSILAYKTKSTEDLSVKFKQDLVKSIQGSGLLPKLSRTTSMHEVRRNPMKSDRLGKIPFQSSLNVNEERLVNDPTELRRHKTTVVDTRPRTDTDEKENHRLSNLPSISRNVHTSGGETKLRGKQDARAGLPELSSDSRKRSADLTGFDAKHSRQQQKRLIQIKEELSVSDTKLDKWFSEMPNEVFDKAQRALMEESIKERLQTYQNKRHKRPGFTNENVHVYVGSKVRKVPNTYLEIRVDSFGKHLQQHQSLDKGEKMNKYKLQQKSMHKLKMREMEEFDKMDRCLEDTDLTPRLSLHHRSLTNLALTKARTMPTITTTKHKQEIITIPTDRAMNTVNINDSVDLDETKRDRKYMSYFEEYTERLNMMKIVADQHEDYQIPHPNSASSRRAREHEDALTEKGAAKASIVNIALGHSAPKKRNPLHITRTILETEHTKDIEQDEVANDIETNEEIAELNDELPPTKERERTQSEIVISKSEKQSELKPGTIITTIPTAPTAQSSRTSTSSSIRSLAKSPLKKFNTLEVFAEHSKALEAKMEERNYHGHKLRDPAPKVTPPSVKLDLKNYSHPVRNPAKGNGEISIERAEVKTQMVFRFEPGEVFITSNKSKQTTNVNTRSSERARIIYGKAVTKGDKKEGRIREHSKENFSTVSLLDGYKSELGRFESRALEGSITSLSEPEDNNKPPEVYLNNNGVMIRDIAIETDVIGSERTVSTSKPNTEKDKLAVDRLEMRTGSGLTDFIVDDNDGESLDSDSDHGGYKANNGKMSKRTV